MPHQADTRTYFFTPSATLNELTSVSREELLDVIEDYRQRLVPRIVPLTLIRHHARTLEIKYLLDQVYLNPHPKELALLNHV